MYDESRGDESEGFAPGTHWIEIPDTWSCPDCAVRDKVDFVLKQP
ncbi:rubredoxin [Alcanivorax sp. S6407]|nr:rubredoxin [Alcanivorax sp. S6407]